MSWSLEQDYAQRLATIQFEGFDLVNAEGDVLPSSVERYRPTVDPDEMAVPRDAALICSLRPSLRENFEAEARQGTSGESDGAFNYEPASSQTPNARVLLIGRVAPTVPHAGVSPAEAGEGRKADPLSGESEDEEVPKRGASAPPSSDNLNRRAIAPKTDVGWKEDRAMFHRFGHPTMWRDRGNKAPVVIESYSLLGPTRLHLEIASASAMPGVNFDRNYDVTSSLDIVKQLTQSVGQLSLRMDTGG